jgi:indolepyruvate ferredoxin oxidoreductase
VVQTIPVSLVDASGPWAPGNRTAHLSGLQAIIRFLADVLREDRRIGLRTAAFVSGYQGSPLAGFDNELQRALKGLDLDIVHRPGVNEELAATAVMGSQLTTTQESSRYDGVLGVWYGKAPGLDRSVDAIRHANYAGASAFGGAIALVGDDPMAKSSTLPSASEAVLADLAIPVLFPCSLSQVIELGQHAVAMSRHTGAWVALKLTTTVADSEGTVALRDPITPVIPDGYLAPSVTGDLLTPSTLERETDVLTRRLAAAARYGDANSLNRLVVRPDLPKMALVAAGTVFSELKEALLLLEIDEAKLRVLGISLAEIRMPYPIGSGFAGLLADGVTDLMVLEERRELIEQQLLSILCRGGNGPRIWGRYDPDGNPFVPGHGTLDSATLARLLYPVLSTRFGDAIVAPQAIRLPISVTADARVPWFCSGCPHSVSTVVPENTLVGAGIGCHSIVRYMPEERVGRSIGNTQMGGEGAQWIGMAPFLNEKHIVQNLGDGTFFHSGHLAVRAAIAAEVNITFKILWNGTSAMTGGQRIEGSTSAVDLARLLLLEGVKQVIITTDDIRPYKKAVLPDLVTARPREDVLAVQEELARATGTTAMIHDQACATDLRRARKRGLVPKPGFQVVINERVCEGCGDCQRKSNCLSLQTVDTPFGPKTRIDENTCNVDLSCLAGDCPAFTLVKVADDDAKPKEAGFANNTEQPVPPAPVRSCHPSLAIRIAGIGGTGVVTAAHLLARAAMLDALEVFGLDQTGLSQKAGPVVSDLRIGHAAGERSNILATGAVDVLLASDLLAASQPSSLAGTSVDRTAIVGSAASPLSGPMILGEHRKVPISQLEKVLSDAALPGSCTFVDVDELAMQSSKTTSTANVALLGVACQLGVLPVTVGSLEEAITQNGVSVESNLAAFARGRAWVAERAELHQDAEVTGRDSSGPSRDLTSGYSIPEKLQPHVAALADELVAYQNRRLANQLLEITSRAWIRELSCEGEGAFTEAVADGAFRLLAYKDEYEVARLLLDHPSANEQTTWLLHPPVLKAAGLTHKIRLGAWARPVMGALRAGRHLRGTPLDAFGHTEVRRLERSLISEYFCALETVFAGLRPDKLAAATDIARLPMSVRGYEELKLQNISKYRAQLAKSLVSYRATSLQPT